VSTSDGDATLRKENKKLQVKTKKAEATADNLKKKLKQDAKLAKALQDKIKALEESLTQIRVAQSDTPISKHLEMESKQEHPSQTPPIDSSESGGGLMEPIVRP
jgi:Skp family chaperone for outer membrane proteins